MTDHYAEAVLSDQFVDPNGAGHPAAYEAICNGNLTHSGDPRLACHVANAIRKPDGQLAKVSKHSPRKIDLAVAMVMALSGPQ